MRYQNIWLFPLTRGRQVNYKKAISNRKMCTKALPKHLITGLLKSLILVVWYLDVYSNRKIDNRNRMSARWLAIFLFQAAHELVPPDAIEPVLRAIVNNFVTERNSSEVMAIGLNAVRELCKRCPLVIIFGSKIWWRFTRAIEGWVYKHSWSSHFTFGNIHKCYSTTTCKVLLNRPNIK